MLANAGIAQAASRERAREDFLSKDTESLSIVGNGWANSTAWKDARRQDAAGEGLSA